MSQKEEPAKDADATSKPSRKAAGLSPWTIAYRLLGERLGAILPHFRDLQMTLLRARIGISFKAYVSLMILTSGIVSVTSSVGITLCLLWLMRIPLFPSLLFGIGGGAFIAVIVFIVFYAYPSYVANSLKRKIEEALPYTVSYMAILASAGVPPDRMFRSLTRLDAALGVPVEARSVVRDVDIFGYDIISALENASMRTPSLLFSEILEGFIATSKAGGDVMRYLTSEVRELMRLKRNQIRQFIDTLGMIGELYVSLLVAAPLIFVVILAVMSFLGGGTIAGLSPTILLYLITYILIPMLALMFLLMLDAIAIKG